MIHMCHWGGVFFFFFFFSASCWFSGLGESGNWANMALLSGVAMMEAGDYAE